MYAFGISACVLELGLLVFFIRYASKAAEPDSSSSLLLVGLTLALGIVAVFILALVIAHALGTPIQPGGQ